VSGDLEFKAITLGRFRLIASGSKLSPVLAED
jgi:hypothetical protein